MKIKNTNTQMYVFVSIYKQIKCDVILTIHDYQSDVFIQISYYNN